MGQYKDIDIPDIDMEIESHAIEAENRKLDDVWPGLDNVETTRSLPLEMVIEIHTTAEG